MNRRTFVTALGSAMLAVSAGCGTTDGDKIMSELSNTKRFKNPGGRKATLYRFVDDEAGVALYYLADGNMAGGLTSQPLESTEL